MMMNHQPLVADALKQIGGEDARFDRLIVLPTGEMLGADYPTQVTRDLNLDVGQFELHGKGVVEDQHPGVAHRRPVAAETPAGGGCRSRIRGEPRPYPSGACPDFRRRHKRQDLRG